jgi:hypothetical protein
MSHNERCRECKVRVRQLLEKIYGTVIPNYRIQLGTRPEELREHPRYSVLNEIYSALQNHRGFSEFVRAAYVDVDFFLPEQKMIVEFDESQHFTEPRKIALSHYPSDLNNGFSRDTWMRHCDEIRAYDNDPPFRDEQRAWYDTLRDFIPEANGIRPTVRLFARDMAWCTLDPELSADIEKFRNLLCVNSDLTSSQSHPLPASGKALPFWIATVTVRSEHEKDPTKNDERLREIPLVIAPILESRSSDGIILFPGGWIHTGAKEAQSEEEAVRIAVTDALKRSSSEILVCIGIDGRMDAAGFDHDQIALLIDKNGIKQRVRKFCASPQEKEVISHDLEPLAEAKKSHIFSFKGKEIFISVCYDICANKPGPKGFSLTNPGVDFVLNLVHRFPKAGEGSGVWYFVRDNFGGASRDWKCPVFGTGIFIERDIADIWRSGVSWNLGNVPTNSSGITADDFTIRYETIPWIVFPNQYSDSYAEVRFFNNAGLIQSKENGPKKIPQSKGTTIQKNVPVLTIPQDHLNKVIRPFIDACDRRLVTITGLKKREFANKNNPKQTRYFFPDWEKMDNRPNCSVYYEINDWNRNGKNEIRIDIQFWNEGFHEIGEQIRGKKDTIGGMMPLRPTIEWYVDSRNPQWSRLQFIFPDTEEPDLVAQSMQVLINETKDTVNDWLISKRLRHY